jgi:hypothetical protein
LVAVLLLSLQYAATPARVPGRWDYRAPVKLDTVLEAIRWKETRGHAYKVGADGERSAYQIMPYVLDEYNRSHRTNFTYHQLVSNDLIARRVAAWALLWNYWRFIHLDDEHLRIVYAVSAYNNGYSRPMKGIIKYVYVQDVIPETFAHVTNRYGVRWKGKRLLQLKGVK